MNEKQKQVLELFCGYAGLQNNMDAEIPNIVIGLKPYIDGTGVKGWDPLDDYSLISPEFLYYILEKAKGFWYDSPSSK